MHNSVSIRGVWVMDKSLKLLAVLLVMGYTSVGLSADFPHKSAIYERSVTAPLMEITSEVYARYADNFADYMEAEWRVQKSPMGNERRFVLLKEGVVYSVDLDTQHCTKTDITERDQPASLGHDPRGMVENMKRQMGLKAAGDCQGAGLNGIKWASRHMTLCMYEDMFPLWHEAMGSTTRVTRVSFDEELPANKISLPANMVCEAGTPLPGMMGPGRAVQQPPGSAPGEMPDMDDAMRRAQEAMQKLQELMQQQQ